MNEETFDCEMPNKQLVWSALNKKCAGRLLTYRPRLALLPAGAKPQSLLTSVYNSSKGKYRVYDSLS